MRLSRIGKIALSLKIIKNIKVNDIEYIKIVKWNPLAWILCLLSFIIMSFVVGYKESLQAITDHL